MFVSYSVSDRSWGWVKGFCISGLIVVITGNGWKLVAKGLRVLFCGKMTDFWMICMMFIYVSNVIEMLGLVISVWAGVVVGEVCFGCVFLDFF